MERYILSCRSYSLLNRLMFDTTLAGGEVAIDLKPLINKYHERLAE
jgi:hypothetical protein